MKIMKKIIEIFRKIVIGYVFYTFLLTLIAFFILPKPPQGLVGEEQYNWIVNHIFSYALYRFSLAQILLWVLVSLLYSVSMLFFRNNREIFIKKLSGIKERDEREVQVIGKAFRASYLTTITILLFLLFMSIMFIHVSKMSVDKVEPGELRGSYAIGVDYRIYHPPALITQKEGYDVYVRYVGIPLAIPSWIFILLVWQIVSFWFVSRRGLKVPD